MKIKHKAESYSARLAPRKGYARPVLREFGLVGTLTQGGSGPTNEVNQMCGNGPTDRQC